MSANARRVYELVARRFLATFAPPMAIESTRADIEAGSESYFVRGSVVFNATAAVGQPMGWQATTTGSPAAMDSRAALSVYLHLR